MYVLNFIHIIKKCYCAQAIPVMWNHKWYFNLCMNCYTSSESSEHETTSVYLFFFNQKLKSKGIICWNKALVPQKILKGLRK